VFGNINVTFVWNEIQKSFPNGAYVRKCVVNYTNIPDRGIL
jgi:hypothetical protein